MALSTAERLGALDPARLRRLKGFGQLNWSDAYVFEPASNEEIQEIFHLARRLERQVVLRGAGRSYGDASVGDEMLSILSDRRQAIREWDPRTGIVHVEGGVRMGDLCRQVVSDGWWPSAVGGVAAPTVSGALAMNIHGKTHYHQGTLGERTLDVEVVTPRGEAITVAGPDKDFGATVGGLGLSGVIVSARIQMAKVPSPFVDTRHLPVSGWKELFDVMDREAEEADAVVTWIDGFSQGRGIVETAKYAEDPRPFPPPASPGLKSRLGWRALKALTNPLGMRAANSARLRMATLRGGKPRRVDLFQFNFPLDQFVDWNRAYLPGGLIQMQAFVPKENRAVFEMLVEKARSCGLPSYLLVLKRHRPAPYAFTYTLDGYSLAMDFKRTAANEQALVNLYHDLARMMIEAGGRFYLAKDSLLNADEFAASMGEQAMHAWAAGRDRLDPDRILASNLSRRLAL